MKTITRFFEGLWHDVLTEYRFSFPKKGRYLTPLEIKILIFLREREWTDTERTLPERISREKLTLPTNANVRCEFLDVLTSVLDDCLISLRERGYIRATIEASPYRLRSIPASIRIDKGLLITISGLTEKGRKELQRCGHL